MTARRAGLLLHPTSLPGRFGIGDLGPQAERFLAWAEKAGQTLWQLLPLVPTGLHDSPYGGASAFAGNPLLISPERLVEEGFLPEAGLAGVPRLPRTRVAYPAVRRWKEGLLRLSWEHFLLKGAGRARGDFDRFRTAREQSEWLPDWALFAALKRGRGSWLSWGDRLSLRRPEALAAARSELTDEIAYQEYVQFLFFRQWARIKAAANRRGIAIVGDIPLYVAHDSADVWVQREFFALDAAGRPELVAGVPPDYFSPDGQLWGYPLYRWDRMEAGRFAWWVSRIRLGLSLFDVLRIDHFRGLAACWAVPASDETARNGRWMPVPGEKLLRTVRETFPHASFVAEDLGTITRDVRELADRLGIPGMKVLQFAFSEDDSVYLPHRHVRNCVVYTGTHDNDTARGWFAGLRKAEKERVLGYLGGSGDAIEWDLIRAAYGSVADSAIVPLQDVFGLGSKARMNTPGRAQGNWSWRARPEQFTERRAARLRRLVEITGRSGLGEN
ncbi:MAG: 4-alpha-glucanotransferase [Thermoanaerobaculia bacterium]